MKRPPLTWRQRLTLAAMLLVLGLLIAAEVALCHRSCKPCDEAPRRQLQPSAEGRRHG